MQTLVINTLSASIQKTNEWLHELCDLSPIKDEIRAYSALRAVLHTLRDKLTTNEVAHLGAQLPLVVRGLYYEGWSPLQQNKRLRSHQQFVASVEAKLKSADSVSTEEAIRAVFMLLKNHMSEGLIENVCSQLPKPIQEFWH